MGVVLVVVLLRINAESRECLVDHGKALLGVVSLGMLLLVLRMTVVGGSVTF